MKKKQADLQKSQTEIGKPVILEPDYILDKLRGDLVETEYTFESFETQFDQVYYGFEVPVDVFALDVVVKGRSQPREKRGFVANTYFKLRA